jgi:hypothetical protein
MSARPRSISTALWFKVLLTGWVCISFWFCYMLIVWLYWETTRIECQPDSQQAVWCKITDESSPTQTTIRSIPKSQLARVTVIHQKSRRPLSRVVLIGIDLQEIPLTTHWGGSVTTQLKQEIDRIDAFIADPQARSLTVETRRDIPLPAIPILGFQTLLNMVLVKKAWTGFKE